MKINFILPMLHKTGGILVILKYARHLTRRGHDVCLYYPMTFPSVHLQHKTTFRRFLTQVRYSLTTQLLHVRRKVTGLPEWLRDAGNIKICPIIGSPFVRKADITIASSWPTAYWAREQVRRSGKGAYFIQDYENWDDREDLLQKSYTLGLHNIVIAPWLSGKVRTYAPESNVTVIPNGVDTDLFTPPPVEGDRRGILALYHESERKNIPVLMGALQKIHEAYPELPIGLFGVFPSPTLPDYIRYTQDPEPTKLVSLYQQAEFLVSFSYPEGWGLPITEALACGCVVLSPETGCIPLINREENIVQTFPPGGIERCAELFDTLQKQPRLVRTLSRLGPQVVKQFSWDESFSKYESVLREIHGGTA